MAEAYLMYILNRHCAFCWCNEKVCAKMCALFLFRCVGPTNATRSAVMPWKLSVGCTFIVQLPVTILRYRQLVRAGQCLLVYQDVLWSVCCF
jgi:hypothetical protein